MRAGEGDWTGAHAGERAITQVAWAGPRRLAAPSTTASLVDVHERRSIRLAPELMTVAAAASGRWIAIGGDDQVVRLYPRTVADLIEFAEKTARRHLDVRDLDRASVAPASTRHGQCGRARRKSCNAHCNGALLRVTRVTS